LATVTLQAYLAELNELLTRESYDEVIGHSTHILKHYPKNLDAYYYLSMALLRGHYYDDAGEVFRRILSADPINYNAHKGLSEVYESKNNLDAAIWHMERIFDVYPNNASVMQDIRRLYLTRNNKELEKIQSTRGALARQYMNSHLYDQAIGELRNALEDDIRRVDLFIMLAEAMLQSGHTGDAGKVALEILKQLPDCVQMNAIMAQIWLDNKRPQDAAPFLERLESLSPQMAAELIAPGEDMRPTAYQLPQFDYRADAAARASTVAPDWMADFSDTLSNNEALDAPDWFASGADLTNANSPFAPETNEEDIQDWFGKIETGTLQPPPDMPDLAPDSNNMDDLFADMTNDNNDDLLGGQDDFFNSDNDDLLSSNDDLLAGLDDDLAPPDMDNLFADMSDDNLSDNDDLFAGQSTGLTDLLGGIESNDQNTSVPPLDETPVLDDSPGWIDGVLPPAQELPVDDFAENDFQMPEMGELFDDTPNEAPAKKFGMTDLLGDLDDNAQQVVDDAVSSTNVDDLALPNTADFADMFGNESSDDDFSFLTEDTSTDDAMSFLDNEPTAEAGDAPDWLNEIGSTDTADDGLGFLAGDTQADDFSFLSEEQANTEADDAMSFLDNEPTAEAGDAPDWLNEVSSADTADDGLGFLANDSQGDNFSFLSDEQSDAAGDDFGMPNTAELAGMFDDNPTDDAMSFLDNEPAAETGDAPDWLNEVGSAEAADDGLGFLAGDTQTDDFSFLSEEQADTAEDDFGMPNTAELAGMFDDNPTDDAMSFLDNEPAAETGDAPDWLNEVGSADTPDDGLGFLTGDTQTDDFSFLSEEQADTAEDDFGMPNTAELAGMFDDNPTDDAMSFLDNEPAAETGDAPDWLNEVGSADTADDGLGFLADDSQGDNFSFLSEEQANTEVDDAMSFLDNEPTAETGDAPDWLNEVGSADTADDGLGFLAGDTQADDFSFLSEEQTDTAEDDFGMPNTAELAGMFDDNPADDAMSFLDNEPTAEAGDAPDWLNEVGSADTPDDGLGFLASDTQADDFSFLAEEQADTAEDDFGMPNTAELAGMFDDNPTDDAMSFLDNEPTAEAGDAPDWLNEVGSADTPDDGLGFLAGDTQADDFSFLAEEQADTAEDDFGMPNTAELAGMFDDNPTDDAMSFLDNEPTAEAVDAPDWLNDLDDAELEVYEDGEAINFTESNDADSTSEQARTATGFTGYLEESESSDFDFLDDIGDDSGADDALNWLETDDQSSEANEWSDEFQTNNESVTGDSLNWMNNSAETDDTDDPAWMNDLSSDEGSSDYAEPETATEAEAGWGDMFDAPPDDNGNELDWLNENEVDVSQPTDEVPDWLNDVPPVEAAAPTAEDLGADTIPDADNNQDAGLGWLGDTASAEVAPWMSGLTDDIDEPQNAESTIDYTTEDDTPEVAVASNDDLPDWLQQPAEPPSNLPETDSAPPPEDAPSWLAAFTGEEMPEDNEEEAPADVVAEANEITDNEDEETSFTFDFNFNKKPAWMRDDDSTDSTTFKPPWMRE